ncbi:(Fe-S)-binding protein [Micrococcales bacterium 31B]|nr:(Fe-S)-binding protein [Micrococcales bacterium 31B]
MRIALMSTCLADTLYPRVAEATVRVLNRLGHDVILPPQQTCCGQMHVNTGYFSEARPVIEHHTRTFADALSHCDAIVAPSGSCVGSVRHQHAMVAERLGRPRLAQDAQLVAAKTYELSEFLVDVAGVTDVGAYFPHTVTYHPTCHSLRMLGVGERPLSLLRAVEGLELVELPGADQCCGFGGTFALKNADTSTAMLDDKLDNICGTGASVASASDSSCLMHIGGGLSQRARATNSERVQVAAAGLPGPVTVHLAEILASTREHQLDLADRGQSITTMGAAK